MTPPSVVFVPSAAGSNWSDYMAKESGSGYWEVAAGTGETAQVSGPTGGDASTTFNSIRANSGAANGQVASGAIIAQPAVEWRRGLQGSFNQLSGPYEYVAIGWQAAGSTAFGQANSAGWVVCERELTPGTLTSSRQSYVPIEGTDGLTDSTYGGGMPKWNASGTDSIVFFFDDYSAGDVAGWTTWDGTTTP